MDGRAYTSKRFHYCVLYSRAVGVGCITGHHLIGKFTRGLDDALIVAVVAKYIYVSIKI